MSLVVIPLHNAFLQVAQTHYKKGYGHGHGKGKDKGVSRPLPQPAYPISYTSLLSEVTPGGGQGGGLQQSYSLEPAGSYEQGGPAAGTGALGYEQGAGGGYELGAGGGYEQGAGGGYELGGVADVIGPGAAVSQSSYSAGAQPAGDGHSEDISLGYGDGGGEGYGSSGYSAPSSGYSAPSGYSASAGGYGSGAASEGYGGSSYTSYSQSGSGQY